MGIVFKEHHDRPAEKRITSLPCAVRGCKQKVLLMKRPDAVQLCYGHFVLLPKKLRPFLRSAAGYYQAGGRKFREDYFRYMAEALEYIAEKYGEPYLNAFREKLNEYEERKRHRLRS